MSLFLNSPAVPQENAGTSLVEAFSLLEIRTHLQMLQTSAAGAKSQVCTETNWIQSCRQWHFVAALAVSVCRARQL